MLYVVNGNKHINAYFVVKINVHAFLIIWEQCVNCEEEIQSFQSKEIIFFVDTAALL